MRVHLAWIVGGAAVLVAAIGPGCDGGETAPPAETSSSEVPEATTPDAKPARTAPSMKGVTSRSGSGLARTPNDKALILADEDHRTLRRIPIPVDVHNPPTAFEMPGAPAQVVALPDRMLVTIRDPGLLLELVEEGGVIRESARVELPSDAWGLAVSADGKTAIVTSAWTHRATGVDLATMEAKWSLNLAREPRGVVVAENDTAYVSHLVGSRITKIVGIHGSEPAAERVEVAPAPLRSPPSTLLDASLGYSLVLSADESRLFLPRHALGAQTSAWWFGSATVDVIFTADDKQLAPRASGRGSWASFVTGDMMDVSGLVALEHAEFVQPRAAVLRASTQTLLVASEGTNVLAELDARALDPSLATKRTYALAKYDEVPHLDPSPAIVRSGGAPSAIALSADEKMAWVHCRSTNDLAIVTLDEQGPIPFIHLAEDTLPLEAAKGRRLYYDATDSVISGGLGCAGCHPDGRDDGHVWHESASDEGIGGDGRESGYRGRSIVITGFGNAPPSVVPGVPRQTPMLAGRIQPTGPYGWRAESETLDARLRQGFALHRWGGDRKSEFMVAMDRPKLVAAFVRQGLVPPNVPERPLTAIEERGRAVFADEKVGCASCHAPETNFTNNMPMPLSRPQHPGFEPEPDVMFKTPSLLYVGGTAPYYHDGAASSLEDLIRKNGKAMGDTWRLSASDQTALVAYLRTIGGSVDAFPTEAPRALPKSPDIYVSAKPAGTPPLRTAWAKVTPSMSEGGCTVKRIDHWVRVDCGSGSGISQIAGSGAKAEGWTSGNEFFNDSSTFIFPLQVGDRHVLQITTEESFGRWGTQTVPNGVLTAYWLDGEAEPVLILSP
jgi:DNA-binding beta-propeller fold protein YncE